MMRRTCVHDYPIQTSQGRSPRRSVLITQEIRKKRLLHVTHLQRDKIYLEEKTSGIKPLPDSVNHLLHRNRQPATEKPN